MCLQRIWRAMHSLSGVQIARLLRITVGVIGTREYAINNNTIIIDLPIPHYRTMLITVSLEVKKRFCDRIRPYITRFEV